MIRFININNGRVFNGDAPFVHWFEDQQSIDLLYVKKLCVLSDSDTLRVVMPENDVFRLLDADQISDSNIIVMNRVKYQDITRLSCNELTISGVPYEDYFVYMVYIIGSSSTPIEARQSFIINDETFIVGADFYDEREELKINLGNFGTEIPESVQRAIYPSNVHEESKDNILLNRKYKELLLDYMNMLGNRGSYSSLLNSLHWFEYGDLLTIKEFWKHDIWGRTMYSDQEFTQVLSERAKNMILGFTKTTYLGVYLAMQEEARTKGGDHDGEISYEKETYPEKARYDSIYNATLDKGLPRDLVSSFETDKDVLTRIDEGSTYVDEYEAGPNDPQSPEQYSGSNWRRQSEWMKDMDRILAEPVPALLNATYKWSRTDLSVKMALLGNFYETYFMPVHMDLVHATIEDIVYTNAIKIAPNGHLDRVDYFESLHNIQCNVKNGQTFLLGDVTTNVDKDTVFFSSWEDCYDPDVTDPEYQYSYDLHNVIGVDFPAQIIHDDDELKNFMVNYYKGPGVIIPIEFVIPVSAGDFIHKTVLSIENDQTGRWDTKTFGTIFSPSDIDPTNIHVKFNLLCTKDRTYDLRIQFFNANGQSYVKKICFDVLDTRRVGLTVYRMKAIAQEDLRYIIEGGESMIDFIPNNGKKAGGHVFSHTTFDIPYEDIPDEQKYYTQFVPAFKDGHGARVNHTLVIRGFVKEVIDDRVVNVDIFDKLRETQPRVYADLKKYYFIYSRHKLIIQGEDEDMTVEETDLNSYYILISKEYDYVPNAITINRLSKVNGEQIILRNDYSFIPQFHYLEPISTDSLEDYYIARDETICVVPDIRYLKNISSYEWVFHNASTLEDINLNSVKEPIVAKTEDNKPIPHGYYDVIFRYRLSDEHYMGHVFEVTLDSAFIQMDETYLEKMLLFHPNYNNSGAMGVSGSSGI